MSRPVPQNAVEAKHGLELGMPLKSLHPERRLGWIQRIIRHDYAIKPRHFENALQVAAWGSRVEKSPGIPQVRSVRSQSECAEHGYNSTGSFRDRSVVDEQCFPDCVRLFDFRERPILFRFNGGRTKQFRFEIVIGQEFVDSPEPELAECRVEQMCMNVDERRGG